MIFDFRLRPPYKSFAELSIFHPVCNAVSPHDVNARHSPSAHNQSMDEFLQEMKEAGIDKGVVMGRPDTPAMKGVPNDEILQIAEDYPDLFVPFGCVDPVQGIRNALAEVDRCAACGFKGIALEPGFCDPPAKADDKFFYPVYARCEQLGLVVAVTMSIFVGPNIDYCSPANIQRVAIDFPDLQIVINHACYPWYPQIFSVAVKHTNIWLLPDMYMLNSSSPGNGMWVEAMNWLDGERILFATSYPCFDMRQGVGEVERFQFSAKHLDKFLFGNAERLLRL